MLTKIKDALSGIVQQQKANAQAKDNLQGYKGSLVRMLGDMRLDPHEVAALQAQQRGLALDPQGVGRVHREVLSDVVSHVFSDGVVTGEELDAVAQIGTALGLGWHDLPPRQLHMVHIAGSIVNIQRGHLPVLAPQSTQIRPLPGETVHAEVGCQLLDERTYRQYVGSSSSTSFRIMKGVTYRVGSTRGRSIPVTEIVPVDTGVFSITDQRLAFVGARQNFSSPWSKVLCAEPMADGVAVSFTNKKKTALLQYQDATYAEVLAALLGRYMS